MSYEIEREEKQMGRQCCPKTGVDLAKTKSVLTRVCTLLAIDPWSLVFFIFLVLYKTEKTQKTNSGFCWCLIAAAYENQGLVDLRLLCGFLSLSRFPWQLRSSEENLPFRLLADFPCHSHFDLTLSVLSIFFFTPNPYLRATGKRFATVIQEYRGIQTSESISLPVLEQSLLGTSLILNLWYKRRTEYLYAIWFWCGTYLTPSTNASRFSFSYYRQHIRRPTAVNAFLYVCRMSVPTEESVWASNRLLAFVTVIVSTRGLG